MLYQPDSILIIKPSALGDIVLALPALTAMRKSFPQARISWLVRPEYAELLRGHPDLNDIILFDRKFLAKSWYNAKAFSALLGLFLRLRKEHFELVIDFQGLFRTGFLAWVTGCRKRFGMAGAREFSHFFYTSRIRQDESSVHLVDYYLKIAVAAGVMKDRVEFKLPTDAGAEDAIRKILSEQGVNCDNYVVIVPGASRPVKRWPIERFAQLADKIAERFGSSIVTTGSQGERQYVDTLKATAKSHILNLAGQTTLRELMALLKGASLVVSNDTGPGHIAAALGMPIVMIFGPTNPARLRPYARSDCVVAVEPEAMGMKIESFEPRYNIRHVTVGQVFEKVCEQFKI